MAKKRAASTNPKTKEEGAPIGRVPEPPKEDVRWSMPSVSRGQPIIFYPRGTVSSRNADIGFVATVGQSSIGISYRNQGLDECYHKDDPRLVNNPEIKNDIGGVWEFTSDQIKMNTQLAELEQRIQMLEG